MAYPMVFVQCGVTI